MWNVLYAYLSYQTPLEYTVQCYEMVVFGSFQNSKSFPVYIWSLNFMKSDSYWKRMLSYETFNDFQRSISEKRALKIWTKIWKIIDIFYVLIIFEKVGFQNY